MYSKALKGYKCRDDTAPINDILSEKLRWTFQVEKLGDIISKSAEQDWEFWMRLDKMALKIPQKY